MVLCSLWEAAQHGGDPGPGSLDVPAVPAPLSGQVLSWPVDPDPEENAVTKGKARPGLQKDGAKVGHWEGTMSKHHLGCKNNDGGNEGPSPGPVWCVRESVLHPRPLAKASPLAMGGRQQ